MIEKTITEKITFHSLAECRHEICKTIKQCKCIDISNLVRFLFKLNWMVQTSIVWEQNHTWCRFCTFVQIMQDSALFSEKKKKSLQKFYTTTGRDKSHLCAQVYLTFLLLKCWVLIKYRHKKSFCHKTL